MDAAEYGGDAEEEVLPAVSTSSAAFAAILDDLVRVVGETESGALAPETQESPEKPEPPELDERLQAALVARQEAAEAVPVSPPAPAPAPAPPDSPSHASAPPARLRGRGDLTLVVGLGADAVSASRVFSASVEDAEVRPGGCSRAAAPRVDDRRGALRARADGVRRERSVIAAYGLEHGADDLPALAESLAGIAPDQVWVAVDASRKAEDTAAWVAAVDAVLAVDGIAASGAAFTSTPESVDALGFPVLWLDDAPR
ncbi:hypothetical protein [Leifsonia sp. NCR5]|uniref:hypothetical protein n=1 Tax=Leifsonia sp. NCR5 TaxID=1978342 RepID=UPI00211A092A|nr:hypothetical protein [Leifsonia sp. NCR5]